MNIPLLRSFPTVILADGDFPVNEHALKMLRSAQNIICCDGALVKLLKAGFQPTAVVGDMDSVPSELMEEYAAIIYESPEQETNDLTKAVRYAIANNINSITVLGATGMREDHTLGNISLIASYAQMIDIQCITDYGVFISVCQSAKFESFPGQVVSIFSLNPNAKVTTEGLKYPMLNRQLASWWQGTLNEAIGDKFSVQFANANMLIYRTLPS